MRTIWASTTHDAELNRSFSMWASMRIFSHPNGFPQATTMGVFNDDNKLIAVMVYHNYDAKAGVVEISGAASDRRWLRKYVLQEMFATPFTDMGCQAVVMRVSPSREQRHIRRMLTSYGFTEHRIPRLRGRDEDECVFVLADDEWRANGFHASTDISHDTRDKAA